jgi:DAK2 domain fusion protein YloV
MKIETIGVAELKRALKSAADYLRLNTDILNNLNVFPVPDGDTGINMLSTLKPAVDALLADGVAPDAVSAGSCAEAWALLSEQANRHSRGNSGFILACFIRGLSTRLDGARQITAELLRGGFESGSYAARSSLLSPVEGTMVTIITAMAEAMGETDSGNIVELLQSALKRGRKEIFETPRLLPVLARAGVVDAGGLGFIFVVEGMQRGLIGLGPKSEREQDYRFHPDPTVAGAEAATPCYRCCTELTVEKKGELPWPELKAFLEKRGNSIALVQEEEYIKLHIHTNEPEEIRAKMAEHGTILASKIDDMAEQINAGVKIPQDLRALSVLAIVPGSGFRNIFYALGAAACLQYGDRLPSSGEILEVLEGMDTENIIVLPNERNIIPAAMLAQKNSSKQVFLIPTENVVQGITALYGFIEEDSPQQNIRSMGDSLDLAVCLKVYQSERDSRYGSVAIKREDFFVLRGEDMLAVDAALASAVERGLAGLELDEAGCISFYYSDAFDQSCAAELEHRIQRLQKTSEVEFHYGGQTGCLLIVAVE